MPRKHLQHKFEVFSKGGWASLLIASMEHATRAAQASSCRSHRRDHDNLESRAALAEALIHMGELSAARQALERSSESRKTPSGPPRPHSAGHPSCCSNGGAAGGPSGMTAEHMRLILESDSDSSFLPRYTRSGSSRSLSTSLCCCEWGISQLSRNQVVAFGASCVETSSGFWWREASPNRLLQQCRRPLHHLNTL